MEPFAGISVDSKCTYLFGIFFFKKKFFGLESMCRSRWKIFAVKILDVAINFFNGTIRFCYTYLNDVTSRWDYL